MTATGGACDEDAPVGCKLVVDIATPSRSLPFPLIMPMAPGDAESVALPVFDLLAAFAGQSEM